MGDSELNVWKEDEKSIVYLLVVISILSMIGSLFIIITYLCFRNLRNYAYKLVTYLSFSDIQLSIGNILSLWTLQTKKEDHLCLTQAFLINFGGLASIFWTSIIAWSIFSATVKGSTNLREKNFLFLLFGFGFSFGLSLIPYFTNQYGRAGLMCWIENEDHIRDTIMRFAQFYVPLWIALIYNIYSYVRVVKFVKKMTSTGLEMRFVSRLKYYPLVLVFCWTFATVNRVYNIFGQEKKILTFLHVIFGGLQGILNATVYGTNEQVKQAWKDKLSLCLKIFRYSGESGGVLKMNEEMQQNQEQQPEPEPEENKFGDQSSIQQDNENEMSVEVVEVNIVRGKNKRPVPKLALRI